MKRSKVTAAEAEAELRAAGAEPVDPYPGVTSKPWLVRCLNRRCPGHTTPFRAYLSYIRNPTYGGMACGECRKQRRANERRADMISLGRVLPMEIVKDVKTPTRSWCLRCWKVVTPMLTNIRSGQGACIYCGGKMRLADEVARQRARAWGYEPDPNIPYVNDATRWPGRCLAKGHYCEPVLNSHKRTGPCETCAEYAFKPDRPALLYLVTKLSITAAKVGICEDSPSNTRLYEHRRNGWTLVKTMRFPVGKVARDIERQIVHSWRLRGWGPVLDGGFGYNGYSETVSFRHISAGDIWREVCDAAAKVPIEIK